MTDPSTPVPSDEAVSDAWCELHDGLPSGCSQVLARKALTAAYAIDAPRIAAEAAAEARAATLREATEWLAWLDDEFTRLSEDGTEYSIASAFSAHFNPEANPDDT